MEYASDAYKEAMEQNVRGESYVWISLDLVNVYAQESAYISSDFTGDETNLYNNATSDIGVTSTESDGSITFTFGEYTTLLLSGVKFTLGNDPLPTTVTITNGTTAKTVDVDSSTVMLEQEFANCSYLKLTPDSGELSVKKISFGCVLEFDHELIMNTHRRNTIRHLNDELPQKEFDFTIHNYDRQWNRDNPFAYSKYLLPKQKVIFKYGREIGENDIYEIEGGVVYLNEWSSDDYKASFSCVGLLDHMQTEYTKGNIYPEGITLYQLAEYVLQDAGIALYELDAVLRTFTVTNPLPVDTHKACLQMIAHAGRCVLYEDRNGAVCLKSIDRPEILKTATLTDATDFSTGNDVITATTNCNYGSTEPEYTKADGLHYFYPEDGSDDVSNFTIDTDVDYIPLPSPHPYIYYYDQNTNKYKKQYFTDTITMFGVTFTIDNNNNSIHVSGQNTKPSIIGTGYDEFYMMYYDEENNITIENSEYAFGVAEDIYGSVGDNYCSCEFWYSDTNNYDDVYGLYGQHDIEKRLILNKKRIKLYQFFVEIHNASVPLNYTFYPKLYKIHRPEVVGIDTLPVGFVSEEYANANGTFSTTPKITINFASPAILADVIMNCPVAPKDFSIKVYYNNVQKAVRSETNNTNPNYTYTFDNIKCDKVEITFTKTTPYQRIHVNNVELGAAVDYEITYHDMTSTPVATSLEKISSLDFELTTYSDPSEAGLSKGGLNYTAVDYSELPDGGLSADITSNTDAISYIHVVPGINNLDVGIPSHVTKVVYSDDLGEGTCEILDYGAFYTKVNASREGDVTVYGTEYLENVSDYVVPVNEIGNPVKVSNPLISTKEHADRLKDWFLSYYANDIEYRLSYRGDPVLDAHDSIFLENQFVNANLIRIETEEISTSGGMDTSNSITARRLSYGSAKPSQLVATDFTLNTQSISLSYVGQQDIISVVEWEPITARDTALTFESSDTDVVTVEGGLVTAVGDGTATITVTSENGTTKTCNVVVVCEAAKELQDFTLSDSVLSLYVGATEQLSVVSWIPADAIGKSVTWKSSNTSVATVSSDGLVIAIGEGNVSITATSPNGIIKTCTLAVAYDPAVVRDFTLSPTNYSLNPGDTVQLSVTDWVPTTATRKTVTYTSSDTSVATVDSSGLVTGVSNGNATITVTCPDGITKTCALSVVYAAVTDFTLSSSVASMDCGDSLKLMVTSWTPSNATRKSVTWASSDSSIASVDANGLVTTNAVGNVTITATCPDGVSKTCTITVNALAVVNFTLSTGSALLYIADTLQLSVTSWTPTNATNKTVTWTSSDTTKATVSNSGLVTAIAEGNVIITATCPDGISRTCAISVAHIEVTDFALSQSSAIIDAGDTLQLNVASWTPNNATYKTVTWTSSNTSIATVSATGLVTAIANGDVTITATCPDGVSKTCAVNVHQHIAVTDFTLSDSTASIYVGNTLQLSVTSWTPADAEQKTVTWSSSDTSKATVSSSGLVTSTGVGNVTITATCPDGISKTCTCACSENPDIVRDFTLSETSATLEVGETLQLSVTSWTPETAVHKTVTWSSSDTSKATVDASGLVTIISKGSVNITATCPDGISKSCSISIYNYIHTDNLFNKNYVDLRRNGQSMTRNGIYFSRTSDLIYTGINQTATGLAVCIFHDETDSMSIPARARVLYTAKAFDPKSSFGIEDQYYHILELYSDSGFTNKIKTIYSYDSFEDRIIDLLHMNVWYKSYYYVHEGVTTPSGTERTTQPGLFLID